MTVTKEDILSFYKVRISFIFTSFSVIPTKSDYCLKNY